MGNSRGGREKRLIAFIDSLEGTIEGYVELYSFGSIVLQYACGELKDDGDTQGYEMRQLIIALQEMTTGRNFSTDILRQIANIAGVKDDDFNYAVSPTDEDDVDYGTSKFYD